MDRLIDIREWCERERGNLQKQLADLKSGKFRISENKGIGWVDVTPESITRVTANIKELDDILAQYKDKTRNS